MTSFIKKVRRNSRFLKEVQAVGNIMQEGGGYMKDPKIGSYLKINGRWVSQEEIEPETVLDKTEQTLKRAAAAAGFEIKKVSGKTAIE